MGNRINWLKVSLYANLLLSVLGIFLPWKCSGDISWRCYSGIEISRGMFVAGNSTVIMFVLVVMVGGLLILTGSLAGAAKKYAISIFMAVITAYFLYRFGMVIDLGGLPLLLILAGIFVLNDLSGVSTKFKKNGSTALSVLFLLLALYNIWTIIKSEIAESNISGGTVIDFGLPVTLFGGIGIFVTLYNVARPQEKRMNMRQVITNIPVIGPVLRSIYRTWINPPKPFPGSESYWKHRYESGGNSGDGSYNQLAEFKAEVLNAFVGENGIRSVIEYGCGDGNQLSLAQYPKYLGFDISPEALSRCWKRFSNDRTKTFKLMGTYAGETAELTLSLDVVFHLVEDPVFVDYMNRLFDSSERFVIIYSSDSDENPEGTEVQVRHRNFSKWVTANKPGWKLIQHIPNRYPFKGDSKSGSFADFYIYSKA